VSTLRVSITQALNSASAENGSNTPDFILAEYLTACLAAFDAGVIAREKFYGYAMHPAMGDSIVRMPAP
jgi:hypothetical protein